jgi:predicted nuclease of predicted toxin-antitoxin system
MTILRVLVDVSAGKAVDDWCCQNGHDVQTVRARDPKMEDIDILSWAVSEGRMVVTMDKDFGELVYHSGQPHAGILLLRLEAASSSERVAVVEEIVKTHGDQLPGSFAVYQNGRLRIRNSEND